MRSEEHTSELQSRSDLVCRLLLEKNFFFFNDTATTEIYTLSLHDALPIYFTDEELDAFYERCQKEVWPKLTELYGQEAVDMVQNLTK